MPTTGHLTLAAQPIAQCGRGPRRACGGTVSACVVVSAKVASATGRLDEQYGETTEQRPDGETAPVPRAEPHDRETQRDEQRRADPPQPPLTRGPDQWHAADHPDASASASMPDF
ncbi:hypothetical protein ACPPVO_27730 [Dactylosporangium sp. McL0621]|uniref:hypothetical protein n=1 Tax=Dactylosporangium sp. McL0621 TaxID=3415678 RepID=UPI003CEFC637